MVDFDKTIDRKNTFSTKWDKYKSNDIIPAWIADSDFATAPSIIEALQERVAHGVFGYTLQGTSGVKDAIVYHLSSQYGWQIDRDWIVPLSSLVSGLSLSCQLTTNKGDEVIVPGTIYPPFNYVVKNHHRERVQVPMKLEGNRWIIDLKTLKASITPKTKLLLFCNPHNPGGTVYSHDELKQLHALCEKHDLFICSDEIHCDLILQDKLKHIPFATLNEDAANRTITLMAASKTYNVAGLGFGFAIISNATIRKKFEKFILEKLPDVNLLGQVATEAAFKHGEQWRLEQIQYLKENHDYLLKEINAINGLSMLPLQATFLAWIDVSALQLKNSEAFFEKAGVGISPGIFFGDDRFIRLNFACSRSTLKEIISRIKHAVDSAKVS